MRVVIQRLHVGGTATVVGTILAAIIPLETAVTATAAMTPAPLTTAAFEAAFAAIEIG